MAREEMLERRSAERRRETSVANPHPRAPPRHSSAALERRALASSLHPPLEHMTMSALDDPRSNRQAELAEGRVAHPALVVAVVADELVEGVEFFFVRRLGHALHQFA